MGMISSIYEVGRTQILSKSGSRKGKTKSSLEKIIKNAVNRKKKQVRNGRKPNIG